MRLDTESLLIVRPSWPIFLILAKLVFDFLCDFSFGLFPELIVATSASFVASVGGCSSSGEDATGLSATPACPPPPTSLIVVSTIRSWLDVSSSSGGCVVSCVSGDGSMGSLFTLGSESANKYWRTAELGGKVVEDACGVVVGEINGGGVDGSGMADPVASELSWRSEDLALPIFRVEVTRPISSATSRMPLVRPDSRSSNEECPEVGGEGEGTMSRAVGSCTGRGAGALVTEIVGKLGGFDMLGFE